MLRSESKAIDAKSAPAENCLPEVTGEFIGKIISSYHTIKNEDAANRKLHIKMPTSKRMRELENFYKETLNSDQRKLNYDEFFKLLKIVFLPNKNDGIKTKSAVNLILFNYFEPNVVSALDFAIARKGHIDALYHYLAVIFQNPKNATSIVCAVLLLQEIINAAGTFGRTKDLFVIDLLNAIIFNPEFGVSITDTYRIIYKAHTQFGDLIRINPTSKHLDHILMHDVLLYIAVKLTHTNQFSLDIYKRLRKNSYQELREIATSISDNPKEFIDKYHASKEVKSSQLSWLTKPYTLSVVKTSLIEGVVSDKMLTEESLLTVTPSMKS